VSIENAAITDGVAPLSDGRISPDVESAIACYREHAPGYDASARRTMWIRERTIARLQLRPGDRVLDIACGTGLSLGPLRAAVGNAGAVVGVEVSPDMLRIARQRVAGADWSNVTLIEAALEEAELHPGFDAVLFHFTHDVMRSPLALQRIFGAVNDRARIAFAGMKYAPWWLSPANIVVRAQARPYMTTFDGLAAPWDLARHYLDSFERQSVLFGTGYIGWGTARKRA
jgi:demethylmenaquinone methyltransferase/2-methoxy-6-polyprenyl-1,4-benzoquinol methylase